jgi:beta-glucosidase
MTAESTFTAPETGEVMFIISGDDGYRFILDGKELMGDWGDHAETSRNATVSVEKGKQYNVRIEYYDNEYNGILKLQTLLIK